MQTIKIDKRLAEQTDSIRRRITRSKTMTDGEKCALLNSLNKIDGWGRKACAQLERGKRQHADYDARTQEDFAAQDKAKKAVFAAMMQGRKVDLRNAAEFQLSQMHTAIHQIRRDIERKALPVILCDEWVRPGEGARPFKRYWIIEKETDNGD